MCVSHRLSFRWWFCVNLIRNARLPKSGILSAVVHYLLVSFLVEGSNWCAHLVKHQANQYVLKKKPLIHRERERECVRELKIGNISMCVPPWKTHAHTANRCFNLNIRVWLIWIKLSECEIMSRRRIYGPVSKSKRITYFLEPATNQSITDSRSGALLPPSLSTNGIRSRGNILI